MLALPFWMAPAAAQFGSVFGDSPPRPPGNVPDQAPSPPPNYPPPNYYPPQQQPQRQPPVRQQVQQPVRQPSAFPTQAQDQDQDQGNVPRPPANVRSDEPPAEPLPAPMSLPPSSRPGGGTIQSEPLAPLPGTAIAPQPPAAPQQVAPQPPTQQTGPIQTLPGLPPGIRQPGLTPPAQPADTAPQPGDEVVVEPPPQRIANPTAVFSGLDKITGRITSFDVAIGETVQFGALQVTPRICYSRPPTETPNTDSFVEVDEVTLQGEIKRIFTGWMFAASPGLHAVEHPIYDVWLTDCKGGSNPAVAEAPDEAQPAAKPVAKQPARPAPPKRPPPPRAQAQPGFLPPLR